MDILGIFVSYLLGSVSFPGLYAKIRGIDLHRDGEGHLGATSIYTATKSPVLFVVLGVLDAAKGLIAYHFFGVWGLVVAMLGHMFPLFFGFRGGNAVSVYYGGLFAITPELVLLCAISEFFTSRILRTKWRHLIYLLIRGVPAVIYTYAVPAYVILLLRHAWFYYVRFRQGSS
ncbi:MAG: acyl phosphate:glycerol-3-phosphate acyltransferase [Candidatus Diapherotrites archaeon]|nr:acyl phosphate:glycerol-3-phosphate acyltransferase [Candidatus Diapherotrites archaeon]MDN5367107.1 acyl phosphate:glycerol-3-phosphate acyltransferase [Candidatus Diapherotrites archaeon]